MFARRYGLVIGIDGDGLSGCVADGLAMGAHLEGPLGGGFGRVEYLLNGEATPSNIRAALARAANFARDLVVVYYAGHSNRVFLSTVGKQFSLAELADLVNDIPAVHRSIILDSCQSGGIKDYLGGIEKTAADPVAFLRALQRERPALRIVTATDRNENAVEMAGRGAFTKTFLNASRVATPDLPEGVISLGWTLKIATVSLVHRGLPRPVSFGPLNSFPFAVSDADAPMGAVSISVGRETQSTLLGAKVTAGVEFSGRKRLATTLQHFVLNRVGTVLHEASFTHWPESSHEVRNCWFAIPGWMAAVPGMSSRVIVRDDRGRVLAAHTSQLPRATRGFYVVT